MHKGGRERREMRKKKGQSEILKTLVRKGEGGDEILEKEEKGFFACYLLTSLSPRHKGHTYIGFTVNPRRRIRQHNGEMCSGAWRTKSKRPWEMVLCIHGFPTNVSALQFEWAWQHPLESLAVRKAAANLKSISGLASKIKIAYTMLTLPAWNSLNLTVNFFSTKYTKHYAGCPSLPDHMKVQVRPMDELPCYTNGDQFSYENEDDMDGEEEGGASGGSTDDQNSFEMPSHEQFGFVENELPLSRSISPVRRIHSAVDSFSTDEQYIQVRPMDDLPCYANGDQFSYENEDGMDGEDECGASGGSADDQNSFELPSHEQFGFLENELPLLPSISPVRTIHSVVGSFSTDDQNIKQFGFRENEMPFSLSDSSVRTIPSLDGSISTNDQNITEILTDLTHEQCEDLPLSLTNSPVRTATSLDGSFSTDDRNITEMPTHERFGCGDSPLSLANSHVRTIASIKGSFSTEGNAEKKRNALLGLVEEDEAPDSLATSLEVETIDLCSPSPECRIRLCSKKRRACTGSPQIIDLTKSPIFVQL